MGNDILNVRCRDAESSQEPDPHPDPFTYPDSVSVDGSEVGDLKKDLIKRHILARDAEATRRWRDARDEHELMVEECAKLFGAIDPAKMHLVVPSYHKSYLELVTQFEELAIALMHG